VRRAVASTVTPIRSSNGSVSEDRAAVELDGLEVATLYSGVHRRPADTDQPRGTLDPEHQARERTLPPRRRHLTRTGLDRPGFGEVSAAAVQATGAAGSNSFARLHHSIG
jgi:hypothetical protein